MPTKSQLVELLQKGQARVVAFAAGLSALERSTSGSSDHWAPRDILAHIGVGVMRWAGTLANGEAPAPGGNPEAANHAMFAAYRSRPWKEIAGLLERAYPALIEQVRALSDEEINNPGHFVWTNGSPVWRRTAGVGLVHPMTHLFQAYLQAGDSASAWRVGNFEMEQSLKLDDSPDWLGLVFYNQACRLAQSGVTDRALAELRRSFELVPNYARWAKEDSDLAALHGDHRFQGMVKAASTRSPAVPKYQIL
jgi:hypothetical protein